MKKLFYILTTVCLAAISGISHAEDSDVYISLCDINQKPSLNMLPDSTDRILSSADGKPYSEQGSLIIIEAPKAVTEDTPVTISEEKRQTRISSEVTSILNAAQVKTATANLNEEQKQKPQSYHCIKYRQQYERSKITVSVDKQKKTFIAGPAENVYLSADVPFTNIKQWSYDAKSNSVVEAKTPTSFYIGINYKFGDVYTSHEDTVNQFKNFALKLLFKATAPSESYGIGLSYDFGPIVIFGARIQTMNDVSASNYQPNKSFTNTYGLSFNIEKGISWLSGK